MKAVKYLIDEYPKYQTHLNVYTELFGDTWWIRQGNLIMNRNDGLWMPEPRNSDKTEGFFADCHYDSPEEAEKSFFHFYPERKPKSQGMQVDFNNVRKQAMVAMDELTRRLNAAILKEEGQYATPNGWKQEIDIQHFVLIAAEDLQSPMDDVRRLVASIGMCYTPGDPDQADVYSELYGEEGRSLEFNPDGE